VVTRAFESERYGGVAAPADRRTRVDELLTATIERPVEDKDQ
jgi:hypothetical protein